MEETVRPRPSQDAKGRRCDAMCAVFSELYSRLRKELNIEVPDLNSALFSKGLISGPVLDKKDIETTLKAIMEALENESVAEKTFDGFTNVLGDISSKEHLAQAMLNNLEDKLKGQQVLYVVPKPATRQVGSTVVVNGSSYSTTGDGQLGGTVPSKSRTECGISSQKMRPELATTTLEDSGLSDGEDVTTTPQQPTDRESTDHNYGVAPEASGTLPLEPHMLPNQLQEIIKRKEQEKRISEDMIDRRDEEIKMLRSLCQQYNDKCDELQLQLLSKKQEAADQKELAENIEEKAKMAEEKAEELAKELEETKDEMLKYKQEADDQKELIEAAEEKAEELAKELEETRDEMLKYKQEADDQKELIEAAEEKAEELAKEVEETKEEMLKYKQEAANQKELAELAEEKADELAKELEETKDEMLKCKQEAADQKNSAELAEEKAEELKELEEKTQEQAKKHEEPEEETRQYKQEAAEHKKMAEQKKEFAFCTELAKHEKVAQHIFFVFFLILFYFFAQLAIKEHAARKNNEDL